MVVTMEQFTASTHVWVRELPHEAGTVFDIVEAPVKPTEISRDLAERFVRVGWGSIDQKTAPLTRPAADLSPEGKGGVSRGGQAS
jgi:hypothetical protein